MLQQVDQIQYAMGLDQSFFTQLAIHSFNVIFVSEVGLNVRSKEMQK